MNRQEKENLAAIRNHWSNDEKSSRAELAQSIQLQLRAIVVLSELSQRKTEKKAKIQMISGAC